MFVYLSILFLSLIYLVLTSVHPFVCLMYLVLTFIIACLLTLNMGLEYLSLIVLLVYVGALAVLFLFVIMLLDIKVSLFHVMTTKPNFSQLGLLIILCLFLINGIDFNEGTDDSFFLVKLNELFNINLIENLNLSLYVYYPEILIIASLILTAALFGSLSIVI